MLLIIALSLLFTPLFFMLQDYLRMRLADRAEDTPADEIDDQQKIIIAGIDDLGRS